MLSYRTAPPSSPISPVGTSQLHNHVIDDDQQSCGGDWFCLKQISTADT